jgi:peptidoglycan/LPS O-acetylase OafA/YrhL
LTFNHPGAGAAAWRPDIDGLRGVAILAVVGYHFFPRAWQAGFVGVDIFFVISGYLITGILLSSGEAGRSALLSFYARRVRRIFPALAVVLAAVMLAGWLLLYDDERVPLGAHVVGGAVFLSNIVLWRESGYFDAAIESKPLAHLWSLAVEEQFYIVWPVLLWLVLRSRRAPAVVAALMVSSLLACAWLVQLDAATAFYVPVFRFWELLAGALLVLAERRGLVDWLRPHAALLSVSGFALLVLAFLLVHSGLRFPGWWAILPVAGTTLLIAAGPQASLNRVLLANRPMVWVGLVSFPLYLWHWPVVTFARIVFNTEPDWPGMVLLATLSLLLAWLTWKLVETPMRAPGHAGRKVWVLAGTMTVLAAGGALLHQATGVRPRGQELVRHLAPHPALDLARNPVLKDDCRLQDPGQRKLLLRCLRDGREPERFALVGDSKAEALYDGLVRTSTANSRWLFVGGSLHNSSVVPVLSGEPVFASYQAPARLAADTVARNPRIETVAIATATRALFPLARADSIEDLPDVADPAEARAGLARFVAELLGAGKRVILVVDNPSLPDARNCLLPPRFVPPQPLGSWFSVDGPGRCRIGLQRHRELSARYRALLEEVRSLAPERIAIFDTLPYLCDAASDSCTHRDGEGPLYSYSDHISGHAARKIGAALNQALERPWGSRF